jgi:nucleoside 2-deoxyribosyltransferase
VKSNFQQRLPKVYIAGPDVFRPDWPAFASSVKELCRSKNLFPLFPVPVDFNPCAPGISGLTEPGTPEQATPIFKTCIDLIKQTDFVAANISSFRGTEPDGGTVFEIGYAFALGKPIVGYTRNRELPENRPEMKKNKTETGAFLCPDSYVVERFGLAANVMVDRACQIVCRDINKALEQIAQLVKRQKQKSFYFLEMTR